MKRGAKRQIDGWRTGRPCRATTNLYVLQTQGVALGYCKGCSFGTQIRGSRFQSRRRCQEKDVTNHEAQAGIQSTRRKLDASLRWHDNNVGLIALFIIASILCLSPMAHAAACCTSATAFGTGRLLMWESWAAGVRSQFQHELGFFDNSGIYEPGQLGEFDQQIRIDAYTMVGLTQDASIFIVVPWLFTRVSLSNGLGTGSNFSDIQVGYRHQVISIGEYEEIPSLALTGAVLFPSGKPRGPEILAHEVTGRGTYAFIAGASLEKTWMPFFAQLNLGGSLQSSLIPSWQVALASGMEITTDIVISGLGQWIYESPSKWRSQLGLAGSWRFDPHLTAQLNINTDLPFNGFGSNWPGIFSYGFGLRYGYF